MVETFHYVSLILILIATTARGSLTTVGPDGIDVPDGLDGTGVLIGEADIGRSGKAGYDSNNRSAPNTNPAGVYFQNDGGMAGMDQHVDQHATVVAGVMIDTSVFTRGAAPMAQLHSIGLGAGTDPDSALVLNRLAANIGGGAISAINMSLGRPIQFLEEDGKSHLTEFVDWSARQHDVTYVVSWPNDDVSDEFYKPQDNFNGITVAASEPDDNLNYHRVSPGNINDSNLSDQYSIDILAPGDGVTKLGWSGVPDSENGSSYAAPHVTGAVALVQQYAQQQFNAGTPRFTDPTAKRHDVMKAVIINSADKLSGVHGSSRTICDTPGPGPCNDWTTSEAFNNSFIPLDDKMGAGHLNVRRAIQQFAPGEYNPGMVPLIGWDRGIMGRLSEMSIFFQRTRVGT